MNNDNQVHYLLYILSRLYAKIVPRRKIMRTMLYEVIDEAIEKNYFFEGLKVILLQLCSIASGYARPLREEHV